MTIHPKIQVCISHAAMAQGGAHQILVRPIVDDNRRLTIALIAHDGKKNAMVEFAMQFREALREMTIVATGTTGGRVADATG